MCCMEWEVSFALQARNERFRRQLPNLPVGKVLKSIPAFYSRHAPSMPAFCCELPNRNRLFTSGWGALHGRNSLGGWVPALVERKHGPTQGIVAYYSNAT